MRVSSPLDIHRVDKRKVALDLAPFQDYIDHIAAATQGSVTENNNNNTPVLREQRTQVFCGGANPEALHV